MQINPKDLAVDFSFISLFANLCIATVHSELVKVLTCESFCCLIILEDLDTHDFENNFDMVIYNTMEPVIGSQA